MASLFDLTDRRRKAKSSIEQYREGASPEELEYIDRYYQEPTASPILQREELTRQLDEADGLKRMLMARGMNNMQAEDAAKRALGAQEVADTKSAEQYRTVYGPGGIAEDSDIGFKSYKRNFEDSQPASSGASEMMQAQGLPAPERSGEPVDLDTWSRQQVMKDRLAEDVARSASADVAVGTADSKIEAAKIAVETAKAKLPAVVADSNVQQKVSNAFDGLLQKLQFTQNRMGQPDTSIEEMEELKKDVVAINQILDDWSGIQSKLLSRSSSGGMGIGGGSELDVNFWTDQANRVSGIGDENTLPGRSQNFRVVPRQNESRRSNE